MLFAQIVLAVEEGEEPEGIDLLIPEIPELVAGIVAFSVVFFFVWRYALPALNRTLEARQQAIAGQIAEAEQAKAEAQSLLTDYQQQLADARSEANRIVDEARAQGEQLRADIVAKAETEADELRRRAREEAAAERSRAEAELRREVASLSLDVAEKVVAGGIDRDAQRALVDRYIDELQGLRN